MPIINYFPQEFTPNEPQKIISDGIDEAIKLKKKFVFIQAPTGSGKSLISKMMSSWAKKIPESYRQQALKYEIYDGVSAGFKGCYVLTMTKQLQDQYLDLFKKGTNILKGKSNYYCDVDPDIQVDAAPCQITPGLKKECWKKDRCMYYRQRNWAVSSQFTVLSYDMYFSLPPYLQDRHTIVCDEASELEKAIVSAFAIEIHPYKLKKLGVKVPKIPKESEYDKRQHWLLQIRELCSVAKANNTRIQQQGALTEDKKRKLQNDNGQLQLMIEQITRVVESWTLTEFIFEELTLGETEYIRIEPLHVDMLSGTIFNKAEMVILMSATFIDVHGTAKRLGIAPKDYHYIEAPSMFDPKLSPIYLSTNQYLKRDNIETEVPKMAVMIDAICQHHKDDKGVIHTQTNKITKLLQSKLTAKRFLFRDENYTNADILTEHYESDEPTVMVSPSLTHGTDLRDESARFQIIVKAPYASLGSKRIKRLADLDPMWYICEMLSTVVQASGRGTRHAEDHCKTYILDGVISTAISKYQHLLPKCFRDRIK